MVAAISSRSLLRSSNLLLRRRNSLLRNRRHRSRRRELSGTDVALWPLAEERLSHRDVGCPW